MRVSRPVPEFPSFFLRPDLAHRVLVVDSVPTIRSVLDDRLDSNRAPLLITRFPPSTFRAGDEPIVQALGYQNTCDPAGPLMKDVPDDRDLIFITRNKCDFLLTGYQPLSILQESG